MITKMRFQIRGMHCVGCAMTIDGVLEDLLGVKSATTNYARQFVDVVYDDSQVTEELMVGAVEDAGYTVIAPVPGGGS